MVANASCIAIAVSKTYICGEHIEIRWNAGLGTLGDDENKEIKINIWLILKKKN